MAKARKKKPVSLARTTAFGSAALKIEFVAVDDPMALRPGEKVTVARNLTPLADLHARGRIDSSQRLAGEWFAKTYAQAELGGAQAIDYTREHVDGGPAPEPLSEQQQEALDRLRMVRRYHGMGKAGYAVLQAVCGEDKSPSAYAKQIRARRGVGYGISGQARAEEGYALFRLIEALDCLVDHLKLIAEGRDLIAEGRKTRIKAESGDNMAGTGDEYEINRIGDLVLRARA